MKRATRRLGSHSALLGQFEQAAGSSLTSLLADRRARLGTGTAVLLLTAVAVRRDRVGPGKAAAFRAVNGLPGSLYQPAWFIMQLGAPGAVPVSAGVAWLAADRTLAGRLLAGGTGGWMLSNAVKRLVRRPRPAVLLPGTRCRGREAAWPGSTSARTCRSTW